MKTVRRVGMFVLCGLAVESSALGADAKALSDVFRKIADVPSSIVDVIRDQDAEESAASGIGGMKAKFESGLSAQKNREGCIAMITYAVVCKARAAAPMMGIWNAGVPPAHMTFVAATAVVAAGDNSPEVAETMIEAVGADDAQAGVACRAACAHPSSVLSPIEMGIIRGIMLSAPPQAPAKAPPLPTIIQPAEKYPGQ